MESNISTSLSSTVTRTIPIGSTLPSSLSASSDSDSSTNMENTSAAVLHTLLPNQLILASAYLQDYLDPSTNERLRKALLPEIGSTVTTVSLSKYISIGDIHLPYRTSSTTASTTSTTNDNPIHLPTALNHPVDVPQVVLTDTVQMNLHLLVFAYSCSRNLSLPRPILLEGPPGSGKTTVVRYLAKECGYSTDMVELHLDDSTDGKSLLGTYVCTDIPGEFIWQPGAITVAVQTGRWVLMEDIDRAPFEVLASLRTLMETGILVIPGNSMVIHTHPNFQLFATRTCSLVSSPSSNGSSSSIFHIISPIHGPFHNFVHSWLRVPFYGLGTLSSLHQSVTMDTNVDSVPKDPSIKELQHMISTLYPTVPVEFLDTLLYSFILLQNAYSRTTSLNSLQDIVSSIHPYQQHSSIESVMALFPTGLERYGRTLSTRDILRLVKRIMTLTSAARRFTSPSAHVSSSSSSSLARTMYLTDNDRLSVVVEILSVVSGHIPDFSIRRSIGHGVAILWNLSTDSVDTLFDTWKSDISYRIMKSETLLSSSRLSTEPIHLQIGDISLPLISSSIVRSSQTLGKLPEPLPPSFAPTRHSVRLLDRLSACIALDEPALLVGETGNGKTSVIQALASAVGAKLHVYNLNVQSDSSDLVGGFKPVHLKQAAMPLLAQLERLFTLTFMTPSSSQSVQQNTAFLEAVRTAAHAEQWPRTIGGFMRAITRAQSLFGTTVPSMDPVQEELRIAWHKFTIDVKHFERQYALLHKSTENNQGASFAFSFIDGVLVQALRSGDWILLDEINLASSETLQRLAGLLEGGSLTLTEKGEANAIVRHPNFRLFGAMNPATDFGKRDLPPSLRNRFTEIYVEDVTAPDDLSIIVQRFVTAWPNERGNTDPNKLIHRIVNFYLQARQLATPITGTLRDGAASRPHYSLRSLTRALRAATDFIDAGFTVYRAVYEGICMSFVTQLEDNSANTLLQAVRQHFDPNADVNSSTAVTTSNTSSKGTKKKDKQAKLADAVIARLSNTNSGTSNHTQLVNTEASISSSLGGLSNNIADAPRPRGVTPDMASQVQGYWLINGPLAKVDLTQPGGKDNQVKYVLVPSVARHIRSLARAVCCGRYPVLLQGPTSAGKTSMVEYLAALTGHECVRINNHEHTDISEYIGAYVTSASGVLVFAEGLLVTALRKGHWLILDELNLAPSEVLEALNRLLDDNRELFIPETQETVRPHPHFMLFATQNPVGSYGGRKPLSLAFRNRFVELHVDDIPSPELHAILMARSRLPSSFVEKMITVMQELQQLRAANDIFAGRHGFITPRDLLRWGARFPRTYTELAIEGYTLLAERLRSPNEKIPVQSILEKVCKVPLLIDSIYDAPFQSISETVTDDSMGTTSNTALIDNGSVGTTDPASIVVGTGSTKRHRGQRSMKTEDMDEEISETDKFFRFVQSRLQTFLDYLHQRDTHDQHEADETIDQSSSRTKGSQKKRKPDELTVTDTDSVTMNDDSTANLQPGAIPGTEGLSTITVTRSLKRLFSLVGRCIAHDEPVLLVGETGCGKTSVIQLFALLLQQPLSIVNCHAHTETADFLGSLRPIRNRTMHIQHLQTCIESYVAALPENIVQELSNKYDNGNVTLSSMITSNTMTMDVGVRTNLSQGILSSAVETWYPKLQSLHKEITNIFNNNSTRETDAAQRLSATLSDILAKAAEEATKCTSLFEWINGPLVSSMQSGGFFLLDEASLAEDAVLERLNSVLEPSRTLTLAEKANEDKNSSSSTDQNDGVIVKAAATFRIFATMNPGGDYGKRELSPALRNRFTEIWVPALEDVHDLRLIIMDKAMDIALRLQLHSNTVLHGSSNRKSNPLLAFVEPMIQFVQWFDQHAASGRLIKSRNEQGTVSITKGANKTRIFPFTLRDIHAWLNFMGIMLQNYRIKNTSVPDETFAWFVYVHGICLVLLDGLGLGMGLSLTNIAEIRNAASHMIIQQAPVQLQSFVSNVFFKNVFDIAISSVSESTGTTLSSGSTGVRMDIDDTVLPETALVSLSSDETNVSSNVLSSNEWGVDPFFISRGLLTTDPKRINYAFTAPTTRSNLCRVLRALQLKKAILLEGSPGVGKTSLIEALANATGHRLVRINLSDQTDIADLFGQDLPTTGTPSSASNSGNNTSSSGTNGRFAWCDGIFLSALKAGDWILLDELNLAPQPVLEGLNAVLDHRGTVYIPELDLSFACPSSLQIFATQNPVGQGGGRKGLPKSFLNRFAKVYVEALTENDQYFIARSRYPQLDVPLALALPLSLANTNLTVLQLMVKYNILIHEDTMGSPTVTKDDSPTATTESSSFSSSATSSILYGLEGRPWEFNLRDLFRWAELMISTQSQNNWNPGLALEYAYLVRLRKPSDRLGALIRYVMCMLDLMGKSGGEIMDRDIWLKNTTALVPLHSHPILRTSLTAVTVDDALLPRGLIPAIWSTELYFLPTSTDTETLGTILQTVMQGLLTSSISVTRMIDDHNDVYTTVNTSLTIHDDALRNQAVSELTTSLLNPFYHTMLAVSTASPVLLVGPTSSGKSTIVKTLASICGVRLRTIPLTPSTDATELIGCFEQADIHRHITNLSDSLMGISIGMGCVLQYLHSYAPVPNAALITDSTVPSALDWMALHETLRQQQTAYFIAQRTDMDNISPLFKDLVNFLQSILGLINTYSESVFSFISSFKDTVASLQSHLSGLTIQASRYMEIVTAIGTSTSSRGAFEWVDGALVEALERGEWILIDNASFCAPSVVDRLNPLLEPHGTLLINECGLDSVTGKPRIITPHPACRIFFTLDPSMGDVSRALRNRCVEIVCLDPVPIVPIMTSHGTQTVVTMHSESEQQKTRRILHRMLETRLPNYSSELMLSVAHIYFTRILSMAGISRMDAARIVSNGELSLTNLTHCFINAHERTVAAGGKNSGGRSTVVLQGVSRPRELRILGEILRHVPKDHLLQNYLDAQDGNTSKPLVEQLVETYELVYRYIDTQGNHGQQLKSQLASLLSSSAALPTASNLMPFAYGHISDTVGSLAPLLSATVSVTQQEELMWFASILSHTYRPTLSETSKHYWQEYIIYTYIFAGSIDTDTTVQRIQHVQDQLQEFYSSFDSSSKIDSSLSTHDIEHLIVYTQSIRESLLESRIGRVFNEMYESIVSSCSTPTVHSSRLRTILPLLSWSIFPTKYLWDHAQILYSTLIADTASGTSVWLPWIRSQSVLTLYTVHYAHLCSYYQDAILGIGNLVPKTPSEDTANLMSVTTIAIIQALHMGLEIPSRVRGAGTPPILSICSIRKCERILGSTVYGTVIAGAFILYETILRRLNNYSFDSNYNDTVPLHSYPRILEQLDQLLSFLLTTTFQVSLSMDTYNIQPQLLNSDYLPQLLIIWRRIMKLLRTVWTTLSDSVSPHELLILRNGIRCLYSSTPIFTTTKGTVGTVNGNDMFTLYQPRDILWRYGGHPRIPRSRLPYEAIHELRSVILHLQHRTLLPVLAERMQQYSLNSTSSSLSSLRPHNHSHKFSYLSTVPDYFDLVPGSLRYDAMIALATIVNVSSDASSKPNDIETVVQTARTLRQRIDQHITHRSSLLPTVENETKDENTMVNDDNYDDTGNTLDTEILYRLQLTAISGPVLRRSVRSRITKAVERWCLMNETLCVHRLMIKLVGLCLQASLSKDSTVEKVETNFTKILPLATEYQQCFRIAERILQLASVATAWSPTDMYPLQITVWLLEMVQKKLDDSIDSSKSIVSILGPSNPQLYDLIMDSWANMYGNWQRRMEAAGMEDDITNDLDSVSSDDRTSFLQKDEIDSLLHSSVPLYQYEAVTYLLQLIAGHGTTNSTDYNTIIHQTGSLVPSTTPSLPIHSKVVLTYSIIATQLFQVFVTAMHCLGSDSVLYRKELGHWWSLIISPLLLTGSSTVNLPSITAQLIAILRTSSDTRMIQVMDTLVIPAVDSLSRACTLSQSDMHQFVKHVYVAQVHINLLRLYLVVPASPIDPALKPAYKRSILQNRMNTKASSILLRQFILSIVHNRPYTETVEDMRVFPDSEIEENLHYLEESKVLDAEYANRQVYRLTSTLTTKGLRESVNSFASLYNEIESYITSLGGIERIHELMHLVTNAHNLVTNDPSLSLLSIRNQSAMWIEATRALANRLVSAYANFTDVAVPLQMELHSMARSMHVLSSFNSLSVLRTNNIGITDKLVFASTTSTLILRDAEWNFARLKLPIPLSESSEILSHLADEYRAREVREETEKAKQDANSSKTVFTMLSETEDVRMEKEFRETIPDYFASHFGEFVRSKQEELMDYKEKAGTNTSTTTENDNHISKFQSTALHIAEEHIRIYQSIALSDPQNKEQRTMERISWSYDMESRLMVSNESLVSRVLYHLHTETNRETETMNTSTTTILPSTVKTSSYNFYRDSNANEAILAIRPARAFATRAYALLNLFEGNEILLLLLRLTDQLLRLPVHSSIAALLTGAELLVSKAQDWENNAPTMHKLGPALMGINQLVTRWRKLELASWMKLLASVEKEQYDTAARLWLHLRAVCFTVPDLSQTSVVVSRNSTNNGTLSHLAITSTEGTVIPSYAEWIYVTEIKPSVTGNTSNMLSTASKGPSSTTTSTASTGIDTFLQQVFDSADRYIRSSTQGQFMYRLQLLESLAYELYYKSQQSTTGTLLKTASGTSGAFLAEVRLREALLLLNIKSFYGQYISGVQAALAKLVNPLMKHVKDQVTLHRWDEQNYYAARDTIEKSHRIVFKALRNYREVLSTIIGPVINDYTPSPSETGVKLHGNHQSFVTKKRKRETMVNGTDPALVFVTMQNYHNYCTQTIRTTFQEANDIASTLPTSFCLPSLTYTLTDISKRGLQLLLRSSYGVLGTDALVTRYMQSIKIQDTANEFLAIVSTLHSSSTATRIMKQRAMTDALRTLNKMGLSYLSVSVSPQQLHLNAIMQLPSWNLYRSTEYFQKFTCLGSAYQGTYNQEQTSAEFFYYRTLDQLTRIRMRIASGEHHQDLSTTEIKRSSGYAEHLLSLLLQQRIQITSNNRQLLALTYLYEQLHLLTTVPSPDLPLPMDNVSISVLSSTVPAIFIPSTVTVQQAQRYVHIIKQILSRLQDIHAIIEGGKALLRSLARTMSLSNETHRANISGGQQGVALIKDILVDEAVLLGLLMDPRDPPENISQGLIQCMKRLNTIETEINTLCTELGKGIQGLDNQVPSQEWIQGILAVQNSSFTSAATKLSIHSIENYTCIDSVSIKAIDTTVRSVLRKVDDLYLSETKRTEGDTLTQSYLVTHLRTLAEDIQRMHSDGNSILTSSTLSMLPSISTSTTVVSSTTESSEFDNKLATIVKEFMLIIQSMVASSTTTATETSTVSRSGPWGTEMKLEAMDTMEEKESLETNEKDDNGIVETETEQLMNIPQITTKAQSTIDQLNIPRIVAQVMDILIFVRSSVVPLSTTQRTVLRTITRWVQGLVTLQLSLTLDYVKVHRQVAKLSLVVTSVLIRLMNDGYCTPPGGEEGGEENSTTNDASSGNKGEGKFHAGTGIGEGTGNKDVSNQIENEEQVLGLKNDQEKEEQSNDKSQPPKPDLDTGVEMDADFDGDMHSLPPENEEENQKQKGDNEDENNEEETDADREMGKADDDNTRIVDEKLWDGDDDEDEKKDKEKSEKKKEPTQADSQVQGGKQKGLRAKQNQDNQSKNKSQPSKPDTLEMDDEKEDDINGNDEDITDDDNDDDDDESIPQDEEGEYQGPIQNEDENKEDIDINGELGKDSDNESLRGGDDENKEEEEDSEDNDENDRKNRIKARKEESLEKEKENNLDDEENAEEEGNQDKSGEEDKASMVSDELGDLKQNELIDEDENADGNEDDNDEQRIDETVPDNDNNDDDETDKGDESSDKKDADMEEEENDGTVNNTVEGIHDDDDDCEDDQPKNDNELTAPDMKNKFDQAAAGVAASNGNSRVQNTDTNNSAMIDNQQQLGIEEDDTATQEEFIQDNSTTRENNDHNENMDTDDNHDIRPQEQGSGDTQGGTEGNTNQQGMWKRAPVPKNNIPQASLNNNQTNNNRNPNNPRKNIRQDPNPLLDPTKALRHWEAKLRQSGNTKDQSSDEANKEENKADQEEDSSDNLRNNIKDVTAQANTGVSMLAPRDTNTEETEEKTKDEKNDSMKQEEEEENHSIPERTAVDNKERGDDKDDDDELHDDDIDTSTAANAKKGKLSQKSSSTAIGSLQFDKLTNDEDTDGNRTDRPNLAERLFEDIINPDDDNGNRFDTNQQTDITIAALNKLPSDTNHTHDTSLSSSMVSTLQDPEQLRARYEETLAAWSSGQSAINTTTAISAWTALSALTSESSSRLCEGLRLILEPTLASKLGGEYRSGKRINMRKVIPYIASNFRKDKIWMRRSKPSQRTYQILLAIDDSLSMAPHNLGAGHIAIEAMALIARALSRLEVGQLGVMSFGDTVNMLHSFDSPFTDDAGARILSSFTFGQQKTHVDNLLDSTIRVMDNARSNAVNRSSSSVSSVRCMQLIFIISDGLVGSNTERERIRQFVIEARHRGILIVSMIIDKQIPKGSSNISASSLSSSLTSLSSASSSGSTTSTLPTHTFHIANGQVIQTPYFEDYPFPYYLILRDTQRLPEALGEALRQWFELMG